jgi:hypothetical protein
MPERPVTEREEQILKLVAEGHTSKQIADMLVISVKTVERHRPTFCRNWASRTGSNLRATQSVPASSNPDRRPAGDNRGAASRSRQCLRFRTTATAMMMKTRMAMCTPAS